MALGDRLKNASGKRKDIHVTLLERNLDVLDGACSANGKTRGEVLDMLIEEALAPLHGEAPEVGMAIAAKLPQIAQYLTAAAPKSPYAVPVPFTPTPQWKPTDAQVKEYKTKVAVALDPYKALDALADGTLTKAHVDALQAVAPKLYQEMLKRIADYGGSGKAADAMVEKGFDVRMVDIASNAYRGPHGPVIEACWWELPADMPATDYGFCADVMEHLPPDRVDQVFEQIAARTRVACYFQIALFEDNWYGRKLHLSVFPPEWWEAALARAFSSVEIRLVGRKHVLAVAKP